MSRLVGMLVPLLLAAAACGDDGNDAASSTTTTDSAGVEEPADGGARTGEGEPTTTEAPTTTVATDAPAAEGPAGAGEDEGLGDALLVADLTAEAQIPGPGDADASGRFEGELVDGVLCIDLAVRGLDGPVTGAEVHEGPPGVAGGVVIDLGGPSGDGTDARWRDVCAEVPDEVIERLASSPDDHYVDVHTAGHPDGAMRGQLAVASIFDRTLD
jgi:hypothetical protein